MNKSKRRHIDRLERLEDLERTIGRREMPVIRVQIRDAKTGLPKTPTGVIRIRKRRDREEDRYFAT